MSKPKEYEVQSEFSTVYMLNKKGNNVFYANVQQGTVDGDTRLTHEQQIAIATIIAKALNTDENRKALSEVLLKKHLTSFEAAGYTKETKFKVLKKYHPLNKGDIVTLDNDDGSACLLFTTEDKRKQWMTLPGHRNLGTLGTLALAPENESAEGQEYVVVTYSDSQEEHVTASSLEDAVDMLEKYTSAAEEMQWPTPSLHHPSGNGLEYCLESEAWV